MKKGIFIGILLVLVLGGCSCRDTEAASIGTPANATASSPAPPTVTPVIAHPVHWYAENCLFCHSYGIHKIPPDHEKHENSDCTKCHEQRE